MQQVHADPKVPQLQVMRKQVSRILQRFTSKRYGLLIACSLQLSGSCRLHHGVDGMHVISILASPCMLHRQDMEAMSMLHMLGIKVPEVQKQIASTAMLLQSKMLCIPYIIAGRCDQGRHQSACTTECNGGRQLPPLGSHRDYQAPGGPAHRSF